MKERLERRGEKGFIKWIVLIVIALALLKYFLDWSIFEAAETEQGKETVGYTKNVVEVLWSYIAEPLNFIWEKILWPVLDLIWKSFQAFLDWGKNNAASGV